MSEGDLLLIILVFVIGGFAAVIYVANSVGSSLEKLLGDILRELRKPPKR